jgi:GAF domain-containing protein/HAMP domain-containing protein
LIMNNTRRADISFSVSGKLFLFALTIVVIIIAAQIWFNLASVRQLQEESARHDLTGLYESYNEEIEALEVTTTNVVRSFANRPDFQETFVTKDRNRLLSLLTPVFDILRVDSDVDQLYLEEPDGVVFLSVHQPTTFGNDVSYRHTVAAALQSGEPAVGVDVGPNGIGVSSVSPIFSQDEFIGLVEVGLDYDQRLLETFKAKYGVDYKVWVTYEAGAPAGLKPTAGAPEAASSKLFHYLNTQPSVLSIPQQVYENVLASGEPEVQLASDDTQTLAVFIAPIYGYGEQIIGVIEISKPWQQTFFALDRTQLIVLNLAGGMMVFVLILMGYSTNRIVLRPLKHLTAVAYQQLEGDLTARVELLPHDEFGQLGHSLNTLTEKLKNMLKDQQRIIDERTAQVRLTLEVAQRVSSILDFAQLVGEVVNLVNDSFNLYHTHIYLLDESRENLVMVSGYGKAGEEMKRQGHSIPFDAPQSLVARAARAGKVVLVEDVRDDPTWLSNPLLPETRSEMAVPIMSGAEVIGVLDVQSEKVGDLTDEDGTTLQALANQIATAVRNARLFAQTQESLYEAQRLQRLYTGQAWQKFRATQHTTDYEYRQPTLPSLDNTTTPEVMAALQQEQTVTLVTNGQTKVHEPTDDKLSEPQASSSKTRTALATPLKLRDEIIGVLGIHDENPDRRWSEEEIALIEAVGEQMSLAIENARLFEHTQRDAWRNRVVSEATTQVWASAEIEEVMKAAVAELGEKLNASEVVVRLSTDSDLISD